ncbi:hypothetical protein THAOC_10161, partial [Thalassiosira oceanica]
MGAVIGPPGEAMEELDSPYHRCCAVVPAELTGCLVATQYRRRESPNEPKEENPVGPAVFGSSAGSIHPAQPSALYTPTGPGPLAIAIGS